jgi:hypothetical protein
MTVMDIGIMSGQNSIGDLGEHMGSPLHNPPAADTLREILSPRPGPI